MEIKISESPLSEFRSQTDLTVASPYNAMFFTLYETENIPFDVFILTPHDFRKWPREKLPALTNYDLDTWRFRLLNDTCPEMFPLRLVEECDLDGKCLLASNEILKFAAAAEPSIHFASKIPAHYNPENRDVIATCDGQRVDVFVSPHYIFNKCRGTGLRKLLATAEDHWEAALK
jgi:hypothetical protein